MEINQHGAEFSELIQVYRSIIYKCPGFSIGADFPSQHDQKETALPARVIRFVKRPEILLADEPVYLLFALNKGADAMFWRGGVRPGPGVRTIHLAKITG